MSNVIRKMQKRGRPRSGLNTRGRAPGPRQVPSYKASNTVGGKPYRQLTDDDLVERADERCKRCHGTGLICTVNEGEYTLVCHCVPKRRKQKKKGEK